MVGIGIAEKKNGSVLKDAKIPSAFFNFTENNQSGNNSVRDLELGHYYT